MKLFITTIITTIFTISMVAFVLSFNACLSAHGNEASSTNIGNDINDTSTSGAEIFDNSGKTIVPVYDKAELIVFNSEGKVIFNEIIDSDNI